MIQKFGVILLALLFVSGCTEARYAAHLMKQIPFPGDAPESKGTFKVGTPYKIAGKRYYPEESYTLVETGIASWYGPNFHGKQTANGEIFDKNELTAAHRTLQMPSIIRVTNLDNGRSLILRVNDRGPFSRGRILDVSEKASELLGFKLQGTAKVRVEVLEEESRQVADAAKRGFDTRGTEVALNQNRPIMIDEPAIQPASGTQIQEPVKLASVEKEVLQDVPGYYSPQGNFLPDPVVRQVPVPSSKVYVQAGSFSQEQNALALSQKLNDTIGPSKVHLTRVDGRPYFRVRLGPFEDVTQADYALSRLVVAGNDSAMIVVD